MFLLLFHVKISLFWSLLPPFCIAVRLESDSSLGERLYYYGCIEQEYCHSTANAYLLGVRTNMLLGFFWDYTRTQCRIVVVVVIVVPGPGPIALSSGRMESIAQMEPFA